MINTNKFTLIAHRGLLNGPSEELENNIDQIEKNISTYPNLINEIDIRLEKNKIFIGHDYAKEEININFLIKNSQNLILHLKNFELYSEKAIKNYQLLFKKCHIFCHENDSYAITNKGLIWSHPENGPVPNTIFVLPEKTLNLNSREFLSHISLINGICTDFPVLMLDLF